MLWLIGFFSISLLSDDRKGRILGECGAKIEVDIVELVHPI